VLKAPLQTVLNPAIKYKFVLATTVCLFLWERHGICDTNCELTVSLSRKGTWDVSKTSVYTKNI